MPSTGVYWLPSLFHRARTGAFEGERVLAVLDIVYVAAIIALIALVALVGKGVERL